MHDELLKNFISGVSDGTVRTIFSRDVRGTAHRLAALPKSDPAIGTIVALSFSSTPTVQAAMKRIASAVAELASKIWPRWFEPLVVPFRDGMSEEAYHHNQAQSAQAATVVPGLSLTWLKAAMARQAQQRELIVPHLPLETNVAQLARAIAVEQISFVLSLEDLRGDQTHRRSFALAAEWLANATRSRVVAVVPVELAGDTTFDAISKAALRLDDPPVLPPAEPLTTVVVPRPG